MIVLIDDLRRFKDNRPALIARTSASGLQLLADLKETNRHVDELWLDHDLGLLPSGEKDKITPVVLEIERAAVWDDPYSIGRVFVHTSNPVGGDDAVVALSRFYDVSRVFAGDELIQD